MLIPCRKIFHRWSDYSGFQKHDWHQKEFWNYVFNSLNQKWMKYYGNVIREFHVFFIRTSLYLTAVSHLKAWFYQSKRRLYSAKHWHFPSFRYQRRAKELSERYKDRPLSAQDTAIYWIEYVARHKGANFMKTAAVRMPFYKYLLLDVIAFILVFILLFLLVFYFICKKILSLILIAIRSKRKTD